MVDEKTDSAVQEALDIASETPNDSVFADAADVFSGTVADGTGEGVISLDDMADVPAQSGNVLLPPAHNVVLRIVKAENKTIADGNLKKIDLQWEIVDGIEVDGEMKFIGKKFFQNGDMFDNVFYFVNLNAYPSKFWSSGKFKTNLKALMLATGVVSFDSESISESFVGHEILGSIAQVPNQTKDESGEYVDDGTFSNCVKYFKAIG